MPLTAELAVTSRDLVVSSQDRGVNVTYWVPYGEPGLLSLQPCITGSSTHRDGAVPCVLTAKDKEVSAH